MLPETELGYYLQIGDQIHYATTQIELKPLDICKFPQLLKRYRKSFDVVDRLAVHLKVSSYLIFML